jgi:competence protein ComEC
MPALYHVRLQPVEGTGRLCSVFETTTAARRIRAGVEGLAHAAAWPGAWLTAQRERLAPWLAVALLAGVLLYFCQSQEPPAGFVWAAPALVAAALLAAWHRPLLGWALGLVAAAALGFAAAAWHAARQPPRLDLPRGAVVLEGVVQAVEALPEGRRVTLSAIRLPEEAMPLPRSLRIRLRPEDPARPAPGDRLRLRALLRPPPPPTHPGAWDFQRAAFFSGSGGGGFALGRVEVLPGGEGAPPFAGLRTIIETRVTAAIPGAAGAVAAALLTGTQSAIPEADMAAMRDSGLAHLLSVSGLHITIVMGVSFASARLLLALWPPLALRISGKPEAALAALAAGGFYLLLTGSQVPMQRSFAMAALVTLGLLTGRRALSPRVLAFAATVVALAAPAEVLGPSFQMSFSAVLALVAGWEALRPAVSRFRAGGGWGRRMLLAVAGLMLTSVLAGAATTPFGLHHFGRLQLYGVAANALAVPLTSALVMPSGMVALALMPLGLEALPLLLMGWGCEAVLAVARAVAAWPGAAWSLRPIPGWGLAALAFGLCWLCLWSGAGRLLGVPLIAAGLLGGQVLERPPDALVSDNGRLIALRTPGGVFLERHQGTSAFVRDAWLRAWGEAAAAPIPREGGGELAPGLSCTRTACRFRPWPEGTALVLLRGEPPAPGEHFGAGVDPAALRSACRTGAVLVSAEPLRGCRAALSVDRFSVWRDGAHALWLGPEGPRILSDRAWRGERPWVPPPPRPRMVAD